jgi:hypothetical protein
MTETPSHKNRGLDRRALLRNGLLAGAATAVTGIASQSFTGVAQAASNRTVTRPLPPLTAQTWWWWCTRCDGLFFGAGSNEGICWGVWPNLGPHESAGDTPFRIPYGNPSYPGLQVGWRWCVRCQLLFWGPEQASSACPAVSFQVGGTPHGQTKVGPAPHVITNNTVYDLWMGVPNRFWQDNWRWCNNCQGLFWGPKQAESACAANPGQRHSWGTTGEYGYSLYYG